MTAYHRIQDIPDRDEPTVMRHDDRACKGADTEVFFPEAGHRPTKALAICGRCAYTAECLDWALETRQTFGVWGGTTESDRKRLLAKAKENR